MLLDKFIKSLMMFFYVISIAEIKISKSFENSELTSRGVQITREISLFILKIIWCLLLNSAMTSSMLNASPSQRSSSVDDDGSVLSAWKLFSIAKDLNAQPWEDVGLVHPKSILSVSSNPTRQMIHGMVSLLLVRIVALVKTQHHKRASLTSKSPKSPAHRLKLDAALEACPIRAMTNRGSSDSAVICKLSGGGRLGALHPMILDNMDTTIERRLSSSNLMDEELPREISSEVLSELYKYVTTIALHYRSVRYHSLEHAYHVLISCSKLLNMLMDFASTDESPSSVKCKKEKSGLTSDPLNQLALLFSAMIHDVDHRGITNQQLVKEGDELAIMYNDQSVAEQRSISLAFSELMKKKPPSEREPKEDELSNMEYEHLCRVIFGKPSSEEYRKFRRTVIDLVLATDIASPERVQIVKSKYKEAFGHASLNSPRNDTRASMSTNQRLIPIEAVQEDEQEGSEGTLFDEEEEEEELHIAKTNSFEETKESNKSGQRRSLKDEFINTRSSMRISSFKGASPGFEDDDDSGSEVDSSSSPLSTEEPFQSEQFDIPLVDSIASRRNVIRRASAPDTSWKPQTQRLGILRALNLTGSTITLFSASGEAIDEELELKTSVIMELLLKAADVSSILQGWENYLKWSQRLFFEMMEACDADRGFDPRAGWFDNQITFFDSYGMLLAKQLMEVGIIGPKSGRFAANIQNLRRRWLAEGRQSTEQMLKKWEDTKKREHNH